MSGGLDVFAVVLTMIGVVACVVSMVRRGDLRALQVALACGVSVVLVLIVLYALGSA